MKNLGLSVKSACTLAFVVFSLAEGGVLAQVQHGPQTPISESIQAEAPNAPSAGSALVQTYISWGNKVQSVGQFYQPVNAPQTFTCNAVGGCTIAAEQQVQILNSTQNNDWGVCAYVDGSLVHTPGCAFQGNPPIGTYVVGTWNQEAKVSAGTHTIQTYIFTFNGAQEDTYNIIYRLYVP
jgi:hypothetical protein